MLIMFFCDMFDCYGAMEQAIYMVQFRFCKEDLFHTIILRRWMAQRHIKSIFFQSFILRVGYYGKLETIYSSTEGKKHAERIVKEVKMMPFNLIKARSIWKTISWEKVTISWEKWCESLAEYFLSRCLFSLFNCCLFVILALMFLF
ncbi:hypothetical protein Hanom_Chr00s090524g01798711 [Helianthus anomalus]